ncbi:hypothetical protein [Pseudomonas huanghezhanensis]|uniref:hypothetical protein n=1 Tax=Pseudomonas huanghezhanensis TaxID=3002903 RepID=UPI0022869CF3|nr:hypothetical protein [Pseudomonas sp. BSw22131]
MRLHESEQVPQLQDVNVWALAGWPLLAWALTFGARAFSYGGALNQHQFTDREADAAQQAWESWANRHLAVYAHCVLLPDEVSAVALTQSPSTLPPRAGEARRLRMLSGAEDRTQAALALVLQALASTLRQLPPTQALRVMLLSDAGPEHHETLGTAWAEAWASDPGRPPVDAVNLKDSLSYGWVDETLKSASAAFELIVVLQLHGDTAYSDGVAAMLLSPDRLGQASALPVLGALCRPMPLDIDDLENELPHFLRNQTAAVSAAGLLIDRIEGQAQPGEVIAAISGLSAALEAQQQWVAETTCGNAGPFGHWLVTALAVEVVRHRQHSLLVLAKDESHWISTVTTGAGHDNLE